MPWRSITVVLFIAVIALLTERRIEREDVRVYPVGCEGYVLDDSCWGDGVQPLRRSRYFASASAQRVIWGDDAGLLIRLNDSFNCVVRDARNWSCKNQEGDGPSMVDGLLRLSHPNFAVDGTRVEGRLYVRPWQWFCLQWMARFSTCRIRLRPLSELSPRILNGLRDQAER